MVRRLPVRLERIKVVLNIWTETQDVRCKEHAIYPRGHAMLLHDVLPGQLGKAAATPEARPLMHGKRCTGNDTGMPPVRMGICYRAHARRAGRIRDGVLHSKCCSLERLGGGSAAPVVKPLCHM